MPVYRLTADCIWNSFRSSGKRHLFLTGSRGSGKTTLLKALFPEQQPGLTTWAEPQKAVWLQENSSGATVPVGIFDPSMPGPGNQMAPLPDGFAALGIPILARCTASDSPWITIDEIGYLEAQCTAYHAALQQLLKRKQVAAVIRKQELPFLQELLRQDDAFVVDLDAPFGNVGCVIMASGGYPEAYAKGKEITIPEALSDSVIVAGAKLDGDKLLTSGGRVLGVIGMADTLKAALDKAYENVSKINFEGAYYRRDIGKRALAAMEE